MAIPRKLPTARQRRFTKLHEGLNELLTEFFAVNTTRNGPPSLSELLSWTKAQMEDDSPHIQKLLWIPAGIEDPAYSVPQVPLVDYPWREKPDRLWTLYGETDPDNPPVLPFRPSHQRNAFLEDEVHDWNMREGGAKLYYASRAAYGGCWVLLLFHEEPHVR